MLKITVIVLLMGVLANAAAIPVSEPAALTKRGNAEIIAKQLGDVPDFNVQITEPTGEGERGDVADETDLSKDIVPEKEASSFAASADADFAATSPASNTDRLLYSTSMSAFLTAKRNKNPGNLNWTDDGCSKSPDKPAGFNFLDSCKRHDFGYRNYKKQRCFTDANRKRVDDNFKKDLYKECSKYSGLQSYKGVACRRLADTYYAAVRTFGGL
ncbi:phospholipase A2 group [Choiromyces venosus 120613-1]|uniref:Phospholipase A2 group n=1 Tax=Choiromyces venosus 120613-1 TaxID=1336337 RepID=A0A3N4JB87_9PEZI|nr:phospholipase A2 group [Choiromyces venosus 120613-1]